MKLKLNILSSDPGKEMENYTWFVDGFYVLFHTLTVVVIYNLYDK